MKDTALHTWHFLPKAKKDALIWLKPADMQNLINKKQFGMFHELHTTLSILYKDGHELSQDMVDCLLFPFKLFGERALDVLQRYKRTGNEKQAADTWISKAKREVLQDVTGETAAALIKEGDTDLLTQVLNVLKNLETTHGLNVGQLEFLELAQAYV